MNHSAWCGHTRRLRAAIAVVAAAAMLGSCADGPFARVNPDDSGAALTFRLVASRDTVTADAPYVAFQVLVEPAIPAPTPVWETSFPGLVHEGDGVFRLVTPSPDIAPIDVRARFRSGLAEIRIYRAPVP